MSRLDPPLPAHWQFYADQARLAHHSRVDDFGYAREELLSETLAVIESGVPWTDDCRRRLERIPQNRAKKYRRLRHYFRAKRPHSVEAESSAIDVADSIHQLRGMLSPTEW